MKIKPYYQVISEVLRAISDLGAAVTNMVLGGEAAPAPATGAAQPAPATPCVFSFLNFMKHLICDPFYDSMISTPNYFDP